jgi:hypothetical protein
LAFLGEKQPGFFSEPRHGIHVGISGKKKDLGVRHGNENLRDKWI